MVTLMGTDVERIVQSSRFIHEIWASLIEIGVGVWLLVRQVSWASVVPLVVCLGTSIFSLYSYPSVKTIPVPANISSSIPGGSIDSSETLRNRAEAMG